MSCLRHAVEMSKAPLTHTHSHTHSQGLVELSHRVRPAPPAWEVVLCCLISDSTAGLSGPGIRYTPELSVYLSVHGQQSVQKLVNDD